MGRRSRLPLWAIRLLRGKDKMAIWEIRNISDPITFVCDRFDIACGTTLILGNGAFGLGECAGAKREMPIFRFWKGNAIADWLKSTFSEKNFQSIAYNEIISEFLESLNPLKIADALRTVQVCTPEEREAYSQALLAIDDLDKKVKYMEWWRNRRQTSDNNITEYAWHLAERMEKMYREKHDNQLHAVS